MKIKHLIFGLLLSSLLYSCVSNKRKINSAIQNKTDKVLVRQDFKKYFDNCNAEGSIAIYDSKKQTWILSDTIGTHKETLPASTFKIINLLIALETKTISSENEIVKWPGSTDTIKYDYRPNIYHDISVKEAFEVSAGWAFIELAKKIGKENYKKYLTLCQYGNLDLSQTDPDFWNFGAFGISPINQVEFLRKFYENKLPFSKQNIEIVKRVMITEQNNDYTIHSKTGWTRENGINTGWWVGYIVSNGEPYFFATRLLQDRKVNSTDFGSCRKEITKSVFKDLNIIK